MFTIIVSQHFEPIKQSKTKTKFFKNQQNEKNKQKHSRLCFEFLLTIKIKHDKNHVLTNLLLLFILVLLDKQPS